MQRWHLRGILKKVAGVISRIPKLRERLKDMTSIMGQKCLVGGIHRGKKKREKSSQPANKSCLNLLGEGNIQKGAKRSPERRKG